MRIQVAGRSVILGVLKERIACIFKNQAVQKYIWIRSLRLWRWRHHVSPNRREPLTHSQDVISDKNWFPITTAFTVSKLVVKLLIMSAFYSVLPSERRAYWFICKLSGFGGLEVTCWPLVPKFEGSNPAEAVGFFREKKSSARLPSEGK